MQKDDIHCISCGASLWVPMFSGTPSDYSDDATYQVRQCKTCGLVRTFPWPEKEEMAVSYGRGAYNRVKKLCARVLELVAQISERTKLGRLRRLTRGRNILDVGSGKGRFVRVANDQHWNAYGYEPYQEANVPVWYQDRFFNGHLEDVTLDEDFFDVVTMWHVLEHIPDPQAMLQSVKKFLKDDGLLLVAVPNVQSVLAKAAKGSWYHLDVPRHLWHFSPESISAILLSAGYEVIGVTYPSNQNLISLWMSIGNFMGCVHNFPWNVVRLNRNMMRSVSLPSLVYSSLVHALLLICIPVLYLVCRVLGVLRQSDTFEVYAKKRPSPS